MFALQFGHIFLIDMLRRSNLFVEVEYKLKESGSGGATCYVELMSLKMKSL